MSKSDHRNAAHQSAVSDILSARRQALRWLMRLQSASGVDWDSPLIGGEQTQFERHPQPMAHAYTLLYARNVANKSYWPKEKDLFIKDLSGPNGDTYHITVPVSAEYTVETTGNPEDVPITLDMFETTSETISLETLNYKWESRQVTVEVQSRSFYRPPETVERVVDLWLPPKAISLAFQQLDELAASLEFLADAKDELPTWGFEEVQEDDHPQTE